MLYLNISLSLSRFFIFFLCIDIYPWMNFSCGVNSGEAKLFVTHAHKFVCGGILDPEGSANFFLDIAAKLEPESLSSHEPNSHEMPRQA